MDLSEAMPIEATAHDLVARDADTSRPEAVDALDRMLGLLR